MLPPPFIPPNASSSPLRKSRDQGVTEARDDDCHVTITIRVEEVRVEPTWPYWAATVGGATAIGFTAVVLSGSDKVSDLTFLGEVMVRLGAAIAAFFGTAQIIASRTAPPAKFFNRSDVISACLFAAALASLVFMWVKSQ